MSRMYIPVQKEFSPISRRKYNFVTDNGETIEIVFTVKNTVLDKEEYMGFYCHECVGKNKDRYVCYISECYCDMDTLLIYLTPEKCGKAKSISKIYINETELVYHLN